MISLHQIDEWLSSGSYVILRFLSMTSSLPPHCYVFISLAVSLLLQQQPDLWQSSAEWQLLRRGVHPAGAAEISCGSHLRCTLLLGPELSASWQLLLKATKNDTSAWMCLCDSLSCIVWDSVACVIFSNIHIYLPNDQLIFFQSPW
jgi:hypothetical protein